MSAVVTEKMSLGARVDGNPCTVVAQFAYEPNDPYAIHLLFNNDGANEWAFSRDLLRAGLQAPAGDCDARIWPGPTRFMRGPLIVHILLQSPDGRVELYAPFQTVKEFLLSTFDAVPAGRESEHLDVDRALSALLGEDA